MSQRDGMETLLTPTDLSERWDVPEGTLTQWRYLGQGPSYVKIGKAVRYRAVDVLAWEEANLHATA